MDPAGVVDQIERGLDAELHLVPELLGRAGEGRRDSKPNLIIGHPADGRGALTCIANRRGACRILADGPRLNRSLICTESKHLVKLGRKLAFLAFAEYPRFCGGE